MLPCFCAKFTEPFEKLLEIVAEENAIGYTVSGAAEGVPCAGPIIEQFHALLHVTSSFLLHKSPAQLHEVVFVGGKVESLLRWRSVLLARRE